MHSPSEFWVFNGRETIIKAGKQERDKNGASPGTGTAGLLPSAAQKDEGCARATQRCRRAKRPQSSSSVLAGRVVFIWGKMGTGRSMTALMAGSPRSSNCGHTQAGTWPGCGKVLSLWGNLGSQGSFCYFRCTTSACHNWLASVALSVKWPDFT